MKRNCENTIGAHYKINGDHITLEAELFSLDGSLRFYEKKTGKIDEYKKIGTEIGTILKQKSKNSYKI